MSETSALFVPPLVWELNAAVLVAGVVARRPVAVSCVVLLELLRSAVLLCPPLKTGGLHEK